MKSIVTVSRMVLSLTSLIVGVCQKSEKTVEFENRSEVLFLSAIYHF